jgi:hypothetical protein
MDERFYLFLLFNPVDYNIWLFQQTSSPNAQP